MVATNHHVGISGLAANADGSLGSVRGQWLTHLLAAQAPDGGFGQVAGQPANSEATALAVLALAAQPAEEERARRGRAWLVARQRDDGSWPLTEGLDEGFWATPWALLALLEKDAEIDRLRRGAEWLAQRKGKTVGLLTSILFKILPEEQRTALDPTLVGWPWHSASFSWVEPTATSVLALKMLQRRLGITFPAERVAEAEQLLYDRECDDGGWNYGNRAVLGEELSPYPDSTALALLALQDQPRQRTDKSMKALRRMLDDEEASGLALALGALCLSVYGDDTGLWCRRLPARYEQNNFLGETRTLAFSLLATSTSAALRIA